MGSVVAAYALAAGYRVRGTVRDVSNTKKIESLQRLKGPYRSQIISSSSSSSSSVTVPAYSRGIEFVQAELDKDDGWEEAVKNVTYILHVASPVPVDNPTNPEKEVIQPAIQGVLHVLKAAATASSTVKRIVVTSSIAAVNEGRIPEWENKTFTEKDWSDITDPSRTSPYAISKTKAEQAAWNFMNNEYPKLQQSLSIKHPYDLVVINPGFIIGPPATDAAASSTIVYSRLFTRQMPAIPNLSFAAIDVRDVALAHLRAMVVPEAANQRFILVDKETLSLQTMAHELAKEFDPQGYMIPEHSLPSFIVRFASYFDSALGIVAPMLDKVPRLDNSLAIKILGFNGSHRFRSLSGSNICTAYSLLARKGLPDKSSQQILSTIVQSTEKKMNNTTSTTDQKVETNDSTSVATLRASELYYYTIGKNEYSPIQPDEIEWIQVK